MSLSALEAIAHGDQGEGVTTHDPTSQGLGKRQLLFQLHPSVAPLATLADRGTGTDLALNEIKECPGNGVVS